MIAAEPWSVAYDATEPDAPPQLYFDTHLRPPRVSLPDRLTTSDARGTAARTAARRNRQGTPWHSGICTARPRRAPLRAVRRSTLLILGALLAANAGAQSLSLDDALRRAEEANPRLRAAQAEAAALEGQLDDARALLWNNPTLPGRSAAAASRTRPGSASTWSASPRPSRSRVSKGIGARRPSSRSPPTAKRSASCAARCAPKCRGGSSPCSRCRRASTPSARS